jgi:2-polyprenyl-6-methoxyphenol hydroxylase-like FAD-dependent oxidoreductase
MNVLVSGAGIAGLAMAYWLRRYGHQVTVVERAPGLREGGQAIDVRGTARTVVERMGLLEAVRAHHTGTRGIAMVDRTGRRLAEMSAEAFGDSGGIVADLEILRGDLVKLLADAVGPEVEYRFDDVITGLADGTDRVTATFRRGDSRAYDLVVGADGVRSGVRALAFGAENRYVRDLGGYSALFPGRSDLDFGGWELMYNMPAGNGVRGRVAIVYPVGGSGEVRVMLSFNSPRLTDEPRGTGAQKAYLARVYEGGGWILPELLDQLRGTDDLYFTRVGEVRAGHWATGRTVLLGDAAHGGSLGMGTSMALVGAYVLAGEVRSADPQAGLVAYQREMAGYVATNLRRPPGGNSGFAPATRWGIWARNQFMRALPHLPGAGRMMGGIQKSANAIALKDYATGGVSAR